MTNTSGISRDRHAVSGMHSIGLSDGLSQVKDQGLEGGVFGAPDIRDVTAAARHVELGRSVVLVEIPTLHITNVPEFLGPLSE